jgi:hypothetical protein
MVGARYGFPCTHLVPGKNKLQTVSLPTLDPPRYNSRFTANGHLHLYPNVGGSKRVQRLSPLRLPQDKSWDTGQSKENL